MRPGGALPPAFAALAVVVFCLPALAHGTAERYDLPLPLGYYVGGAALVVALSFVVSAIFIYVDPRQAGAQEANGKGWRLPSPVAGIFRGLGVAVLLLVIVAGLFGDQHPAKNIAPSLVWVAWWVGLSLLVALMGDMWVLLNPWRTLGALWLADTASPPARPRRSYPAWLSQWPAVVALLVFVWIELVSPVGSSPRALALLAVAYTGLTLLGMRLFGASLWLERGEVFTIAFRLLGRFAPLAISEPAPAPAATGDGGGGRRATISLRPPGQALLEPDACSNAMVALLLLLLSAVLFDGLLGTAFWRAIERRLPLDRDGLVAATLGLVATWLAFLGVYVGACRIMRALPGRAAATAELSRRYALTLVPIAIGYNIAHNFAYLLVQGQSLLALASDPFGWGWNVFGTAGIEPDIGIVGARTTWLVALLAIVGGHVASVVLAHMVGVSREGSRYRALIRLLPLTIVMILYTAVSLSIIADPLVRFRAPDPGYS
jgi:hypothetical protein